MKSEGAAHDRSPPSASRGASIGAQDWARIVLAVVYGGVIVVLAAYCAWIGYAFGDRADSKTLFTLGSIAGAMFIIAVATAFQGASDDSDAGPASNGES